MSTNHIALCGLKPGSAEYKAKSRNTRSKYLLGDNLKEAAKDAKGSEEITKKDSHRKDYKVKSKHYTLTDQEKPSLHHGCKTGQNFNRQSTNKGSTETTTNIIQLKNITTIGIYFK